MKAHFSFKHLLFLGGAVLYSLQSSAVKNPVDYVSTLVGTQSKFELSTGNTYPATALPWGMNFWTPQTGKMGDGWAYTYNADKIRGFKQTHQPSPWMNDYGQFAIMPITGGLVFDQDRRASWFSHKADRTRSHRTCSHVSLYVSRNEEFLCHPGCLRQRFLHQSDSRREQDYRLFDKEQRRCARKLQELLCSAVRQAVYVYFHRFGKQDSP